MGARLRDAALRVLAPDPIPSTIYHLLTSKTYADINENEREEGGRDEWKDAFDKRLHCQGHQPGRLGPERNFGRRTGNARPDGGAREVRRYQAAEWRARFRVVAHDHRD